MREKPVGAAAATQWRARARRRRPRDTSSRYGARVRTIATLRRAEPRACVDRPGAGLAQALRRVAAKARGPRRTCGAEVRRPELGAARGWTGDAVRGRAGVGA